MLLKNLPEGCVKILMDFRAMLRKHPLGGASFKADCQHGNIIRLGCVLNKFKKV